MKRILIALSIIVLLSFSSQPVFAGGLSGKKKPPAAEQLASESLLDSMLRKLGL